MLRPKPLSRLEQLVVGRQDVLNFRRCPRFLQHQAVDQHGLVGHAFGHALQLGQGATGGNQLLDAGFTGRQGLLAEEADISLKEQ